MRAKRYRQTKTEKIMWSWCVIGRIKTLFDGVFFFVCLFLVKATILSGSACVWSCFLKLQKERENNIWNQQKTTILTLAMSSRSLRLTIETQYIIKQSPIRIYSYKIRLNINMTFTHSKTKKSQISIEKNSFMAFVHWWTCALEFNTVCYFSPIKSLKTFQHD